MAEYTTQIGAELAALEEYGTEAFDADEQLRGNALANTGHPNDPTTDQEDSGGLPVGMLAIGGAIAIILIMEVSN